MADERKESRVCINPKELLKRNQQANFFFFGNQKNISKNRFSLFWSQPRNSLSPRLFENFT